MASNRKLTEAAKAKNDEFYTQYSDIQSEMNCYYLHNKNFLRDKTVLLPCDDPEWSMFTEFFIQNFERYGLKKLISTSYAVNSKKIRYGELSLFETESPQYDPDITDFRGKIFTLTREDYQHGAKYPNKLQWRYLEGDGDFRSKEVQALRNEADVIITNPPFSLFREFLKWINPPEKQFLIIANKNCITYKEVFPLIKDNIIWVGCMPMGKDLLFMIPPELEEEFVKNETEGSKYRIVQDKILARSPAIWLTNLDHSKRHEPLILNTMEDNLIFNKKLIKAGGYRKYDNYDAIDVPFTDAIPSDYFADMGVPITFLDKHNPDQFEIVKFRKGDDEKDLTYTADDNTIFTASQPASQPASQSQNYAILQNHHSTKSVAASWECQSPSSTDITQNNLKLSGVPINTEIAAATSKEQVGVQKLTAETSTSGSLSGGKCNGVMGVPITFLDKYCPEQFEIVGRADANIAGENNLYYHKGLPDKGGNPIVGGKMVYKRILIRFRRRGDSNKNNTDN